MNILIPQGKASRYDVNSVIFKKNHRLGVIIFMKVYEVHYHGFKQSKTHILFKGKKLYSKPLKPQQ